MNNQELNDGCARAMGWKQVTGLPGAFAPLDGGWVVPHKRGIRYGWEPATNPRDAWEVLCWLWSLIDPETIGEPRFLIELTHGANYYVVLHPYDNTRPLIEVWGESEEEAICLAAIEVGKHE